MKRHIFLVDDDEYDVSVFLAAINDFPVPCKCTWAKTGEQALKQLAYLTPDIIFLDAYITGASGLECLAEIKRMPHLQAVPIVLHSSSFLPYVKDRARGMGVTAFLEKPDSSQAIAELFDQLRPGNDLILEPVKGNLR